MALSLRSTVLTAILSLVPMTSARCDDVEKFYQGRNINFYIGFGPGGGYDTYARVLARHMGRHIPGQPTVTPMNMPGGGGLTAANYLYNVAARDGASLATFGSFNALESLFGNKNANFETLKFTWIGNMAVDSVACAVWRHSGITSVADMKNKEVIFGSSGAASTTSQHVLAMQNLIGIKAKIITGYKGTKDINLAMQRGEVDGSCGINASSALSQWGGDIKDGNLKIIIQFGRKNHPVFGEATNIYDLLGSDEDKRMADLVFGANEIGRPIAAPPAVPADRAAALRRAFNGTLAEKEFLADAARASIPIDIMTSAEVEKIFARFLATPPKIVARSLSAIGRN
jgi:tripartite-type tricarboxylate transporter receptor subunit TctC